MPTTIFLQAALHGDSIHPAALQLPSRKRLARAVDVGAQSVHVHAFDDAGRETLEGAACAKVLRAIRLRCPETPISLKTSRYCLTVGRHATTLIWSPQPRV